MRALIWVQHLLGVGHAVRAGAIARALCEESAAVTLATGASLPGSVDTQGFDVIRLPAARASDPAFSAIIDEDGGEVDDAFWQRRRDILLALIDVVDPDIVVTEAFPLARRAFRAELVPFLQKLRAKPRQPFIAASVRDILVRKPPDKERAMADLALAYYDKILIHSDPQLVRLEHSFGEAERLAPLVTYTGFVNSSSNVPAPSGAGEGEVIVSCGGGAVGRAILQAALSARLHSSNAGTCLWRVLAGPHLSPEDFAALTKAAPPGVIVERARRDFPDLLTRARLSVSQAGYNTAVDILQARVPALLVPFAAGSETEQTQRADLFAGHGLAVALPEKTLSAETLARAADEAMQLKPKAVEFSLDGAKKTAKLLIAAAKRGS
ncbi:putative glycosyltransferase [Rhodopseudomonas julia]|uniref:Glycosyltransferase n=1 Tax=Rhodopseudomonas julia TaxID=200617 RepID=A0ABU0C2A4_9BRAD|nr:glycosyltransferase [Rhodopseudomonas julia]MDQ0324646.1 putative glycosyltransferase [Rhodopseudomonas julia]